MRVLIACVGAVAVMALGASCDSEQPADTTVAPETSTSSGSEPSPTSGDTPTPDGSQPEDTAPPGTEQPAGTTVAPETSTSAGSGPPPTSVDGDTTETSPPETAVDNGGTLPPDDGQPDDTAPPGTGSGVIREEEREKPDEPVIPRIDAIEYGDRVVIGSSPGQSGITFNCGWYGCRVGRLSDANVLILNHGEFSPQSYYLLPPPNDRDRSGPLAFGDAVVISQTPDGGDTFNCGQYGCRVARTVDNSVLFTWGSDDPQAFHLESPQGWAGSIGYGDPVRIVRTKPPSEVNACLPIRCDALWHVDRAVEVGDPSLREGSGADFYLWPHVVEQSYPVRGTSLETQLRQFRIIPSISEETYYGHFDYESVFAFVPTGRIQGLASVPGRYVIVASENEDSDATRFIMALWNPGNESLSAWGIAMRPGIVGSASAAGHVVVVGFRDSGQLRFFYVADNGVRELGHLELDVGCASEYPALGYHAGERRYYLISCGGDDKTYRVYRSSEPGWSLLDRTCTGRGCWDDLGDITFTPQTLAKGELTGGASVVYDQATKGLYWLGYTFEGEVHFERISVSDSGEPSSVGDVVRLSGDASVSVDPNPGFRWAGTAAVDASGELFIVASERHLELLIELVPDLFQSGGAHNISWTPEVWCFRRPAPGGFFDDSIGCKSST